RSRRFPRAVRVNAGGRSYTTEAGEVFAADTGFRGGTPRSTPFEVAGTDDDPLYYSRRFGRSFTFAQNVPNGTYTLRLHFAEPTFMQSGRRRFDVFAEGQRLLRHYDIFADVGHQTAAVKEREVSVTDGRIDLWFRGVVENAIVSAVELLPSPQERALQGMALVNAGGGHFTDSAGRAFNADTGFIGGCAVNETFAVEGTEDDALFSSHRAGSSFTFSRPIADGNYAVLLEFAEPVSGAAAGQRKFDVSAEGRTVLDDYDVAAGAGPRAAVAEAFNVTIADGALDLSFAGVVGEAVVSAIVVVPTDVPEAARPYSVECMAEPVREAISARNLRAIGQAIMIFANENRGRMPPDLETLYRTQDISHQYFANPRSLTPVPRGDLSRVESAGWIDTLNDYVYVGQGLRSTMPSDTPLAYENPDRVSGDVFVLRLDGSVVRLDRATAAQRLGFDPDKEPTGARPQADFSDPSCMPDANVVGSAAHLRAISRAMLMHANENRGNFPPDAGTLVATQHLDPGVFLNPRNDTPLPPDGMNTEEAMAWVNATSDYVYAGANRRTSDPADTVLAYENPAEMADGINILFADGRVEFREMRWAIETIRRIST
ncbi:MAG TPA: malectin domain-containing carbohydrate-binding protein, partial [Tepidisphaeraceae bacterium]|nr:malectin domain-containing carbohydrate-binding protein [Tepidisphaeraceae bacterium]